MSAMRASGRRGVRMDSCSEDNEPFNSVLPNHQEPSWRHTGVEERGAITAVVVRRRIDHPTARGQHEATRPRIQTSTRSNTALTARELAITKK
jgi:hypothetical protein